MLNPHPQKEEVLLNSKTMEEIRMYLQGQTDPEAVNNYLELPSSTKLAGIAARSGKGDDVGLSADDLVKRATELNRAAANHLAAERELLASKMNRSTLFEVATRLNIPSLDDWSSLWSKKDHFDSVDRPVVLRLVDLEAKVDAITDQHFSIRNPEYHLQIADSRTTIPRPKLECSLDEALRWAANAHRAGKKALAAAFSDCARLHIANDSSSWVESVTGSSDHEEITDFSENFKPKRPAPELLDIYANFFLIEHWEGKVFATPEKLAWLSLEFHDFWRNHQSAYSIQRSSNEKNILKKIRSVSGGAGSTKRENIKFEKHAQEFLQFIKREWIPKDSESRKALFVDFAQAHLGLRGKKPQANVAGFLEILFVHQNEDPRKVLSRFGDERLREFNELPKKKQNQVRASLKKIDLKAIEQGRAPKKLMAGWSFDKDGIKSALDILRPAFKRVR